MSQLLHMTATINHTT